MHTETFEALASLYNGSLILEDVPCVVEYSVDSWGDITDVSIISVEMGNDTTPRRDLIDRFFGAEEVYRAEKDFEDAAEEHWSGIQERDAYDRAAWVAE